MNIWYKLQAFVSNKIHYMRLHTKMLIMILLSVFLPLVTALTLLNRYYTETSAARSEEALRASFSQTYDIFSDKFELVRQNISLLLLDETTRILLQKKAYNYDLLSQKNMKESVLLTIDFIEKKTEVMQVHIYVPDAYTFIIDSQYFFPFRYVYSSAWFQELYQSPYKNLWISPEKYEGDITPVLKTFSLADEEILSYAIRVCSPDDYFETVSVLRLDFSRQIVENTLSQALTLEGSSVALLDRDSGEVVAWSALGEENPVLPDNFNNLRFSESWWTEQRIDGKDYYVLYRSFKDHPWALAMTVPQHSVYDILDDSQWLTFILMAVVCGVVIFVVCLLFSKQITDRLSTVSDHMKALKSGDLQPIASTDNKDEIGELTDSYNYMLYEIEMLIQSKYLSGVTQKEAELRALQAQINPHFLYNTLELINYYAFENNPRSVERIVSLLAKFYKLSLNKGQDIYHVWQELELTEIYFEIQNIRYQDQFSLKMEVPQSLFQYEIPKITLQPLLENSIRHGILWKADQRGEIRITGEKQENRLVFVIEDNGVGISPDKLAALNDSLEKPLSETEPQQEGSGSHYGIRNVHERIQNYYGKSYGLRFESAVGVGTKVVITIPAV